MDAKTLEHALEPFYTTKGVGKGTGLRLSSVYGIVKQSDDYIWLYSEPGQGLVTDVVMPRMSGRELAVQLGRIRPGLPVLSTEELLRMVRSLTHHG